MLLLSLSLSLLKSKIASFQVQITQNQHPHIQNPPTIHPQRIPKEYPENSQKILTRAYRSKSFSSLFNDQNFLHYNYFNKSHIKNSKRWKNITLKKHLKLKTPQYSLKTLKKKRIPPHSPHQHGCEPLIR